MRRTHYLCLCAGGNVRSVNMARLLKDFWHQEALAAGVATGMSADTLAMLYEWADVIVVMDAELMDHVPDPWRSKRMLCDVGPDNFGVGFPPALARSAIAFLRAHRETFGPPLAHLDRVAQLEAGA
jgi:predicted protein tyrosine phosphatase